ncbi:MAG: segregation and condensation protein A [Acidimicrobiales bacterium]
MAITVQTPVYEGPFDLLLHLILRDEVDLYNVSLGTIVDEYLAELDRMQDLDLDIATEFLLIAATLVELKSRRLLPGDSELALDEELGLWEERDLLLARLLECKTFKDAARSLEAMSIDAGKSVPRVAGPEEQFLGLVPDLLEGVTGEDIRAAFKRAVTPRPKPTLDLFHVTPVKMSVAETVASLADELPTTGRTTLRDLTSSSVDRVEVIVYFLALLELFKQGAVELTQLATFGTMTIDWVGFEAGLEPDRVDTYEG